MRCCRLGWISCVVCRYSCCRVLFLSRSSIVMIVSRIELEFSRLHLLYVLLCTAFPGSIVLVSVSLFTGEHWSATRKFSITLTTVQRKAKFVLMSTPYSVFSPTMGNISNFALLVPPWKTAQNGCRENMLNVAISASFYNGS